MSNPDKLDAVEGVSSVQHLEAKVLDGVRWVAVGQIASQLGRFAVSIVLARLLAPSEFGLMAMASVIIVAASLLPSLGMGQAVVQRETISEPLLRTLGTLAVLTGFLLTGILALAANSIVGPLFAEPKAGPIVAILGTQFAIQGFAVVPASLLQREMRLNRLVLIDAAQLVTSSGLAVALAVNGWGVWGLVAGNLVGHVVRTVAILVASPWTVRFGLNRDALQSVAGFSAGVLGTHLVHYLGRVGDRLAIGRFLGTTPLGLYDYACRLYWYPLEVITPILGAVMFPALSRVQDDNEKMGRAFLRANGLIAFVVCPVMIGLAAVADPFVRVLLGDRWLPVVHLVEILAPAGILAATAVTAGELLYAKGKSVTRLWLAVFNVAVTLTAVVIGLSGGVLGVAMAIAIVRVPLTIVTFAVALRLVKLPAAALWRTVRQPVILSVIMGAAVVALRNALQTVLPEVLVLAISVLSGVLIYVVGGRLQPTQALADLYRLLPGFLQRRPFVAWLFVAAYRPA